MIVGVGCLAHDNVLVTETPWSSGKGRIIRRETRIGGNARTALATVVALGEPAAYLATIGNSSTSEIALADLLDHGIETRFIERVPGADPVTATLTITSDGERYIAFDDASLANTPLPGGHLIDEALEAARVLIVDATTAPAGSLDVVRRARSRGIPVVLDAERTDARDVRELVDAADHIVVPLGFAQQLTERAEPTEIISALWRNGRSAVVLTDGPRGSFAADSVHSISHIPAFEVDVVDTTGCGDTFHGAYAWALFNVDDLISRVRFASAAAAVVAARGAGHARVPSHEETVELMRRKR